MNKETHSNWPYIFWFIFYFFLFWLIFGANSTSFLIVCFMYAISMTFALSPLAEALWRNISGVRPLRLRLEKNRLLPLFEEVYIEAYKSDNNLQKNINIYVQEDMEINAFAFGRSTLVLSRGSIELLNDECLKGLIAHELGHFAHYDTVVSLFATIGNFFMSLLMRIFNNIKKMIDTKNSSIIGALFDLIYTIFRGIQFIGDLILMPTSREHEYMADQFALKCGFGKELTEVLIQIYQVSISTPKSVKEQLRSTHPPITKRIERLETVLY